LYVVRAPDFEDDPPASDRTLIQPSSHHVCAAAERVLDPVTAANAAAFDELPTIVKGSPTSEPSLIDTATSQVRVNTRQAPHPWSEEAPPSIQVNAPAISLPLPPMSAEEKASFFSREQVTRLEAPPLPLPSAPQPTWSDPTGPGVGRARPSEAHPRIPPVRIAMGVAGALCLVMGLLARQKNHDVVVATAPATTARASATASVTAPPAVAVAPQASPVTPPPTAAPDVSGGSDEVAAVESVESGDLTRAATLYAALSAAHPTNEAYREAARILRQGTKGAHP
jgi:hypothetical protein